MCEDVISIILLTRVRTNRCSCLLDDNQNITTCESLQYMTSHLSFAICSVLFRYSNNFAPKSAASSCSRASVYVFTGATLVLAIRNAVYISFSDVPLNYATAP